ncbi:MAG: hypothetical protein ACLFRY_13125 [Spirochaetia bacterium]
MKARKRRISFAVLNLLGYFGTVVVNALANSLPINERTTGELSDMYPNLFVPAGLTFSIWGIIYVLLGLFTVYGLISAIRKDPEKSEFIDRVGILFFAASAANIGWIFLWHHMYVGFSLIAMVVLLVALLGIYIRLGIGKRRMRRLVTAFAAIPFSVYLGWITIATVANVTALLVDVGWQGWGFPQAVWTIIVLAVAFFIALLVLLTRGDLYYALVVEWAFLGILIKRVRVDAELRMGLILALGIFMGLLFLVMVVQGFRRRLYVP